MTIGDKIKQLREERGWRPTYLAVEADVPFKSIYNYESNKAVPRLNAFRRICKAFGITTDEFLEGVDD